MMFLLGLIVGIIVGGVAIGFLAASKIQNNDCDMFMKHYKDINYD